MFEDFSTSVPGSSVKKENEIVAFELFLVHQYITT